MKLAGLPSDTECVCMCGIDEPQLHAVQKLETLREAPGANMDHFQLQLTYTPVLLAYIHGVRSPVAAALSCTSSAPKRTP